MSLARQFVTSDKLEKQKALLGGASSALPANINSEGARLPQNYENAKRELAACASIDECLTWADKSAALASYAKQAKDDELMKYAVRVRDRAIRRAGELLKQVEPAKGGDRKSNEYQRVDTRPLISRQQAAADAGLSQHKAKQAIRVANVPAADFERQVESKSPPTVTALAEQGKRAAPKPVIDLKGRNPDEFNRAMHFVGAFEGYQRDLMKTDADAALPILIDTERERIRKAIAEIDSFHDRIITRI